MGPTPRRWQVPREDLAWLLGIVLAFVAAMTYLGQLRYENFFTGNWDLGINQQLLWSTAHGRLLYETGDVEFYGVNSFLQVHPTYVAFLVVPLYAALPYPATLFAVQAVAVALASVPLYLLSRRVIENRLVVGLVIVLFLTSFPVLSGLLYDFHWEAFLPLEFLMFFYLYQSRRYWLSLIPLAFGILTLEVFPFLVVGLGLLILYECLERKGFHARALLGDRDAVRAIVLLVAMVVVYVALRAVQYLVIPSVVGIASTSGQLSGAITSPFAINATAASLNLSTNYWLLLLAGFAFFPLLAPRYLWLSAPWFVYSFFLSPFFSSQFGDQYALVAVATLAVPLVYGAARFERIVPTDRLRRFAVLVFATCGVAFLLAGAAWSPLLLGRSVPWPLRVLLVAAPASVITSFILLTRPHPPGAPAIPSQPGQAHRFRWRRISVPVAVFAVFIAFNVLMSPINTENFHASEYPGYWLQYGTNPAASEMGWLTGHIPSDSVVLASDFLFPYVANNPNAWAVPWFPVVPGQPPQYLPFNATHLPKYVLIDEADWTNFPCPIASELLNRTVYGLVAYVYSVNYLGTISLYELGYTGAAEARFVSTLPPVLYFSARNLTVGPSGAVRPDPTTRFGEAIVSTPGTAPVSEVSTGNRPSACHQLSPFGPDLGASISSIWSGPGILLPAGKYEITANLTGRLLPNGSASRPILTLDGGTNFAPPLYNFSVPAAAFNATGWSDLVWNITVPVPYPLVEFRGYLDYYNGEPNGEITLNCVEVRA